MSGARRFISAVAGTALTILAVGALVVRYVPISDHLLLVAVIAAPMLMLGAPLAVVALAWGRHWIPAAVATCVTIALIVVYLPSYLGSAPHPDSVSVRIMTINMRYGHADPEPLTQLAAQRADVVMAQELPPEAVRGLAAAGLDEAFPYEALDARTGASGVGIYSRFPLTDIQRVSGFNLALVTAKVTVPGAARPVAVASIHLAAPWPQPIDGWRDDIAAFPGVLQDLANEVDDGSVIVAGDFNSTIDMRPFRDLLTDGFRDAAEQAGDGRNLTFPANRRFPPLIGIDHVLTRNATAVTTSTIEIPDTDHRALLATVMVPKA